MVCLNGYHKLDNYHATEKNKFLWSHANRMMLFRPKEIVVECGNIDKYYIKGCHNLCLEQIWRTLDCVITTRQNITETLIEQVNAIWIITGRTSVRGSKINGKQKNKRKFKKKQEWWWWWYIWLKKCQNMSWNQKWEHKNRWQKNGRGRASDKKEGGHQAEVQVEVKAKL